MRISLWLLLLGGVFVFKTSQAQFQYNAFPASDRMLPWPSIGHSEKDWLFFIDDGQFSVPNDYLLRVDLQNNQFNVMTGIGLASGFYLNGDSLYVFPFDKMLDSLKLYVRNGNVFVNTSFEKTIDYDFISGIEDRMIWINQSGSRSLVEMTTNFDRGPTVHTYSNDSISPTSTPLVISRGGSGFSVFSIENNYLPNGPVKLFHEKFDFQWNRLSVHAADLIDVLPNGTPNTNEGNSDNLVYRDGFVYTGLFTRDFGGGGQDPSHFTISKFGADSLNFTWAISIDLDSLATCLNGNQSHWVPTSFDVDSNGNIYLAINFGFETIASYGANTWVSKISSQGNFVWSSCLNPDTSNYESLFLSELIATDSSIICFGVSEFDDFEKHLVYVEFGKDGPPSNYLAYQTPFIPTSNNFVYPNPSNGLFNLEVETGFSVFNSYGFCVQHNQKSDLVDLEGYPAGVYFLKTDGGAIFRLVLI